MTSQDRDLIRRALDLLHKLVADDEPCESDPAPRCCPVALFAKRYLARDSASDLTSHELWQFFGEVAASGEVEPLSKTEFLRRLPGVMEAVFGVRESHNVLRTSGRVRGFRGITVREQA